MEAFIIYIAKTGICLGIFLIIYSLFLRPATFFRFNRLFLLSGFVASLIIPAIKYTYEVVIPVSVVQSIETTSETVPATPSPDINIWIILSVLYLIGTLVLIGRNMYVYVKLRKLVKSGVKSSSKGFKVIESTDINSPFTVLNYILVNTNNLSLIEKDLILKHEITHISQKHWVDLLCGECILLLQWFNPLAWIYVKLLKENHEFLADKAVIDSGVSPALYQAVLINQKFQGPVFSFSNSFNYSKPLNRLSMIKKAKSSPWKRSIVLAIIPIFGLFLWASSEPRYVFDQTYVPNTVPDDSILVLGYGILDKKENILRTDSATLTTRKGIVKMRYDSISTDKGNTKIEVRGVYTMTGGDADPVIFIDGKKSDKAKIKSINPADVESVSVLKDALAAEMYGEDTKQGVIHIKTKEYVKKHPEQEAKTIQDIKIVSAKSIKKDSITWDNNPAPAVIGRLHKSVKKDSINRSQNPVYIRGLDLSSGDNTPIYFIDGKKVKSIQDVKPNDIESISVLKDDATVSIYGPAAKNGVILITTKKQDKTK